VSVRVRILEGCVVRSAPAVVIRSNLVSSSPILSYIPPL
jgi:hypothetical protein